jgi:hypothetical protein
VRPLPDGVDREYLGYVALRLGEEHGRAMVRAFLAQLVVQGLVKPAHVAVMPGSSSAWAQ